MINKLNIKKTLDNKYMEIIDSVPSELITVLIAKDSNILLKLQYKLLKIFSKLIDTRFNHYDLGLASEIFDNLIKIYTNEITMITNIKKFIVQRNELSRHSLYTGLYTEITLCTNKELLNEIISFL